MFLYVLSYYFFAQLVCLMISYVFIVSMINIIIGRLLSLGALGKVTEMDRGQKVESL